MEIGIVGYGIVGNVTFNILKSKHNMKILDPDKGYTDNLSECEIIFICINEKDPTMKNLDKLIDDLVKSNTKAFFVIRTTVIPGTIDKYIKVYKRDFVFMPEFIREWNVEYDTFHPDKIIIGTENKEIWGQLYGIFSYFFPEITITQVKPVEAELTKLALNSLALIKIVFAEELNDLAKALNADYGNIYKSFSLDQNINVRHLIPGKDGYRGASGKCLPKDTEFLVHVGKEKNSRMSLLETADILNDILLKIEKGNNK
jgi:UDPglucose 6-dehydrogenase